MSQSDAKSFVVNESPCAVCPVGFTDEKTSVQNKDSSKVTSVSACPVMSELDTLAAFIDMLTSMGGPSSSSSSKKNSSSESRGTTKGGSFSNGPTNVRGKNLTLSLSSTPARPPNGWQVLSFPLTCATAKSVDPAKALDGVYGLQTGVLHRYPGLNSHVEGKQLLSCEGVCGRVDALSMASLKTLPRMLAALKDGQVIDFDTIDSVLNLQKLGHNLTLSSKVRFTSAHLLKLPQAVDQDDKDNDDNNDDNNDDEDDEDDSDDDATESTPDITVAAVFLVPLMKELFTRHYQNSEWEQVVQFVTDENGTFGWDLYC